MERFVMTILGMSVQAGVMLVVVFLIRKLFEILHVSKQYMMVVWVLPFLCLVFPGKVGVPNGFWREEPAEMMVQDSERGLVWNLEDEGETVAGDTAQGGRIDWIGQMYSYGKVGEVFDFEGVSVADVTGADQDLEGSGEREGRNLDGGSVVSSGGVIFLVMGGIWAAGLLILAGWNVVGFKRLKKNLLCSIQVREDIYIGDDVCTPMVVGIFRPRIYLPSGLLEEYEAYVIAHEQTHIRRGDAVYKLAAYLITCVHWFNPLVWYAFYLFGKDMEMTCDEETIKRLGVEEKTAYAKALLEMAARRGVKRDRFLAMSVAFEEGNVKNRIQHIVTYKKGAVVVTVVALAVCAVVGAVFMTKRASDLDEVDQTSAADKERYRKWFVDYAGADREAAMRPLHARCESGGIEVSAEYYYVMDNTVTVMLVCRKTEGVFENVEDLSTPFFMKQDEIWLREYGGPGITDYDPNKLRRGDELFAVQIMTLDGQAFGKRHTLYLPSSIQSRTTGKSVYMGDWELDVTFDKKNSLQGEMREVKRPVRLEWYDTVYTIKKISLTDQMLTFFSDTKKIEPRMEDMLSSSYAFSVDIVYKNGVKSPYDCGGFPNSNGSGEFSVDLRERLTFDDIKSISMNGQTLYENENVEGREETEHE